MSVLDDIPSDGHTQACTLSYRFGGEEVLKKTLFGLFIHAFAIVLQCDNDVVVSLLDGDGNLGLVVVACRL